MHYKFANYSDEEIEMSGFVFGDYKKKMTQMIALKFCNMLLAQNFNHASQDVFYDMLGIIYK